MATSRKILFYFLILLPVLVLAVFSFVQTKRQLIDNIYRERQNLASVTANMLHEKLDRLNEIGVSMASWPVFHEQFKDGKLLHAIALLKKIPHDFSYINHAFITDDKGRLIASSEEDEREKNFTDISSAWYQGVSKNWEPYISGVYKDPNTKGLVVTALAVPIKNQDNKVSGILVLEVDVLKLLQWSNKIRVGESGIICIVDQNGKIAISPAYQGSKDIIDYAKVPAVQKAMNGEKNVAILYNPVDHRKNLTAYEKIEPYGWAVLAQQEASGALSINKSLWPVILFFVFVLVMASFFATVLVNSIVKQQASRKQLELLTRQINQANDAVYTLDNAHRIQSWNRGAQKIYGFTAEEVLGKNSDEVLQTALSSHEIQSAREQITKQHHWSGELKRKTKSGADIFVQSSITCIMDEETITGFVAVNFDVTDQRKLQRQVNHFANIVEQSSEAIFSKDTGLRIISWNKGAEKLFGFSKDEVLGKTAAELGIVSLTKQEEAFLYTSLDNTGQWESEKQYYRKNGQAFYGVVTANSIRGESNNINSVVFFVKDISERKRLENELKKLNEELEEKVRLRTAEIALSEKRYRYLFENSPLPMWIFDVCTLKFLDVNKRAVEHYGYSKDEFLAMTILDIRPKEDQELLIQNKLLQEEIPLKLKRGTWTHIKKDGTYIKVQISAIPINFGETNARLILAHDVTDQEKAKEKLAASEKRFRTLIDNNYDVIALLDKSFNIIYRSPAAERVTGWTNEDMLTLPATKNIHPDDLEYARAILKEALENPGKEVPNQYRMLHKKGHYIWVKGVLTNRLNDENVQAIVSNYHDITEQKEAAEKIIEIEKKYRIALDNMMEGVQIIGFDWKYIYVNDAIVKQSHYTKDQFIGHSVMELFPGIEQSEIFQNCLKCMNERTPILCKTKMVFPDNRVEWFEQSFQPVPEGIFILSVDITEVHEAEDKLKEQTAQLQTLSNNLPGVMIYQMAGTPEAKRFTYISEGVTKLTGNTPGEVMQNPMLLYQRILPEDMPAAVAAEQIAFKNLSTFNVEVRFKSLNDGIRWLNIIATPRKTSNGEIVWDGFHVDITDRKNTAEAIKKSEEHYRLLVEQSADGIFLCDIMGNCIAANTAGCKMLGYTLDEILTKNLTDALAPEDHYLIAIEIQKLVDGGITSTEWNVHRKDGSVFVGEVISRILPEGRLQLILRDITERKETETRIKKLNEELEHRVAVRTEQLKTSNEEMEAFTYSVSHDLRAPLRGIIGFTSILEEEYCRQLDDEAKRITSVIKGNTIKMGQLIDDLLKFSRISRHAIEKSEINMDEMVKHLIISSEIKSISNNIQWNIGKLHHANGDVNTIRQVWVNLLQNAIKYSTGKAIQEIEIGSYLLTNQVVFFVKDNGVGFEQAYSRKLFKVFQRLHNVADFDGTGVGLAIVEKIISKHGGKVWAQGEVNKGATFYFSLPVAQVHNQVDTI